MSLSHILPNIFTNRFRYVVPLTTPPLPLAFRYPDSYCCGPYHESAILLTVEHNGKTALHCPWMLVDSDRALIAGREILGFPKKMGQFSFTVSVPSTEPGASAETFSVRDPDFNVTEMMERDATVAAEVWRRGVKLVSMSGSLRKLNNHTNGAKGIFLENNVFINVQTNYPLPPEDNPDRPDTACLGNRPRLIQTVFDEVPTDNIRQLAEPTVSINQSKIDAIGLPFGVKERSSIVPLVFPPDSDKIIGSGNGGGGWPLDVVDATFGVTNFHTGEEDMITLGATVDNGYIENNDVYWLRYQ